MLGFAISGVIPAIAFQFASTNLVWELGLVLWVLIGYKLFLNVLGLAIPSTLMWMTRAKRV